MTLFRIDEKERVVSVAWMGESEDAEDLPDDLPETVEAPEETPGDDSTDQEAGEQTPDPDEGQEE